jgi:hypothetical protein
VAELFTTSLLCITPGIVTHLLGHPVWTEGEAEVEVQELVAAAVQEEMREVWELG